MSLSSKKQEDYYHAYWSKIEKLTDGEPTMFIRDYLTLKKGTISNIEDLYFDFKSYDMKFHIDRQVLLEDMLKFENTIGRYSKAKPAMPVSTTS